MNCNVMMIIQALSTYETKILDTNTSTPLTILKNKIKYLIVVTCVDAITMV